MAVKDIGDLANKLDISRKDADQAAFNISKAYHDYIESTRGEDNRVNFRIGDGSEVAGKGMDIIRNSVEDLYSVKRGSTADGLDALILSSMNISEDTIKSEVEGQELTPSAISGVAERNGQSIIGPQQQVLGAWLQNTGNLENAQNYIEEKFQAAGYSIKKNRINARNALSYIDRANRNAIGDQAFIDQQKAAGYITPYQPKK
jgi:hypothetical protein